MKKTQVALAALALVASTAAMADGVTISGRIDAGLVNNNSTVSTSPRAQSGLLAPNFLNFGGSEDLGNGMKANFLLSETFSTNAPGTGTANTTTLLQSHVGVSGDFGSISIGKTVDSFWGNGVAAFDVTGGGNMGSAVSSVFANGASNVFQESTIHYVAPTISGVNAAATYITTAGASGAGGITANAGDYSVAATYDIGGAKVGAAYSKLATVTNTFVGAGYDFGFAKVNATYLNSSVNTTYGANAAVPLVGALTGTIGYYNTSSTGSLAGTDLSIGLLYGLSKRTTVFGNYEKVTGATVLNGGNGGIGTDGNAIIVGVAHSF